MGKEIYEMKHTRAGLIAEAEKALSGKDQKTFDEKMKAVKDLNNEIDNLEMLDIERGRFEDSETQKVSLSEAIKNKEEDEARERTVTEIRSSNEYARAFCSALRNKISPETALTDTYRPLQAALTESGGTPEGSQGGFLVPIDVDNTIQEARRSQVALIDLVNVENVTAPTGWRVKDVAPTKGFTKLTGELEPIPEDDEPQFSKIDYKIEDYGLFIPISKQLMMDEDANLLSYLGRWFGKKAVITENNIILVELNKLVATDIAAGNEISGLKDVVNTVLDPDIEINAEWIANQNGFNILDKLVDGNGRPMLQPDVTQPTAKLLSDHPVTKVSNGLLADETGKSPIFVGDFEQYLTVFRRQALEVATTDVGGGAWRNYGFETRGIMRLDAQIFDGEAAAKVTLTDAEEV